jgi:hypothetical protein
MKEDMLEPWVVKDHMSPLNVAKKGTCCCQLMLRLQKRKDVDQP